MLLNDTRSKLDLEITDDELLDYAYEYGYIYRLEYEHPDLSHLDLLCLIENQLRRERGLIPA